VQNKSVVAQGRLPALKPGITEREVTADLQKFSATIRAIHARARQLNFFAAWTVADPFEHVELNREAMKKIFELPAVLPDFYTATTDKIAVYQDVRYFAESIVETVTTIYGAMATCILPVLYALLGACAYLLRTFEYQIRTRTFAPSDANIARFIIAAIGGAVVGLFNNFKLTQDATIRH